MPCAGAASILNYLWHGRPTSGAPTASQSRGHAGAHHRSTAAQMYALDVCVAFLPCCLHERAAPTSMVISRHRTQAPAGRQPMQQLRCSCSGRSRGRRELRYVHCLCITVHISHTARNEVHVKSACPGMVRTKRPLTRGRVSDVSGAHPVLLSPVPASPANHASGIGNTGVSVPHFQF
jgi:hypothetical protein